jgi:hypothetical protein
MKLLSPSPEAVATVLGLSLAEAGSLLEKRRLEELQQREATIRWNKKISLTPNRPSRKRSGSIT